MKTAIFYFKAIYQLLWKMLSEFLFSIGKKLSRKRAILMARRRYANDHKTYYVIEGDRWLFFVGNSGEIDRLKRMRVFDRHVNSLYLNDICCFKIGNSCPDGTYFDERLTYNKKK